MVLNNLTKKDEDTAKALLATATANLNEFSKLLLAQDPQIVPDMETLTASSIVEASGNLAEFALRLHNLILSSKVASQPIMPAPVPQGRRRRDDFMQDMSFDKMKKAVSETFFGSATVALLEGVSRTGEPISSEDLALFLLSSLRGHDLLAASPDNKVILLLKDTGLPLAGILIKRIQAAVDKSDELAQINGVFLPFHAGTNRLESFMQALETVKPLIHEVIQTGGGMHPAIGTV